MRKNSLANFSSHDSLVTRAYIRPACKESQNGLEST
jgi:hypothetical protein